MISVEQHLDRILATVTRLEPREVPVPEASGCVLARDVVASLDLPTFTNSAMDGYAVRAADCAGAGTDSPVQLPVSGEIAAGDRGDVTVEPGHAVRIMTGAPVPDGADAIVPFEDTDDGDPAAGRHGDRVTIRTAPQEGAFIRRQGEDVRNGQVVLQAEDEARGPLLMGPGRLALAAATGATTMTVYPRPRVAIISSGDELVPAGTRPGPGQIVDSNGLMLQALVEAAGAVALEPVRVPDDEAAIRQALRTAADEADLVITTGGVSMGVYDTIKTVLKQSGEVQFDTVAMKPGSPQGFGRLSRSDGGSTPVFTLPGNPISALVSFHVFVLPALGRMSGTHGGRTQVWPPSGFSTHAGEDWPSVRGKVEFTRIYVDGRWGRRSGGQGSHHLGAMASGMAIAIIPATMDRVREGDTLYCMPLLGAGNPRP